MATTRTSDRHAVGRVVGGLLGAALLASGAAAPAAAPDASNAGTVGAQVSVVQGTLQGRTDGDVRRYRGIPYAAAPVGALRWQPPQPPPTWTDTRPATESGPRCPQPGLTAPAVAEDCLSLEVTVPANTPADARLPVLVWIHGGGFASGSGAEFDPRRLATAGPLVVVTVNYRLGILGFYGLPGVAGSGAFGLLDQQAALRWVRDNISAFGGDPGSVTIAGESAGADSVCSQLTSPAAAGLFHRAVLQSGGCNSANLLDVIRPGTGPAGDTWKPLPLVEQAGTDAAAALGCPGPPPGRATTADLPVPNVLDCLRALPVERLAGGAAFSWSPAIGTPTLPRRPSEVVAAGEAPPGVPVLAGTNRDEGTLFAAMFYALAGAPLTDTQFRIQLAAASAQDSETGRAYPTLGRSPDRAWAEVITDRAYACTGLATYRALAARGPVYAYEFADPAAPTSYPGFPPDLAGGSTHGSELPYLFDLTAGQPAFSDAQQATADELVDRWARFATTGDPNGGRDATPWPAWTDAGAVLVVRGPAEETGTLTAAEFADAHRCALWGVS